MKKTPDEMKTLKEKQLTISREIKPDMFPIVSHNKVIIATNKSYLYFQ